MTNKTRYIPLLLLLLALFSCTSREEREFSALLDRADSLMRTRPDSSLYILNKVGTPSTTSLSMRHALLRADALNKCDSVLPSDTLLRELADYYDRHGSANERMRAHYLLGRCYHDMGEAPRALECYQHAAELADTTRKDCDLYTLYAVYGQMADLYYAQYLPDDEMQALKTCERIAWKDGDTLSAIKAYELRLRPYYQKNDTDSILFYVNHSYQLYRKYGYNKEAANILYMKIAIALDRGHYQEAGDDMQIYKKESGLFDEHGNILRGRELQYYNEGRYQLGIGHVDSALYWFQRTLSYGYKEAAYKGMLDVYKQKHIPDSVAKYAELFAKANDDSYLGNSMELMRMQTSLYNYQQMEKENHKLQQINEQTRWYSIVLALLALIATFILIAYYQYTQKRIIANQRRIQLLQQVNEKITRGKQNTINQQNGLNDSLNTQIKQSKDCLQQLEMRKKRELTMSILSSEVGKKARKTAKEQDGKFSESDWQEIFKLIDKNFPSFKQSLHILHKISDDEYKICVLEILEFKNIEIAHLLFKEPSTISTSRKRIFEKLSSSKGSATDLRTFLYSI